MEHFPKWIWHRIGLAGRVRTFSIHYSGGEPAGKFNPSVIGRGVSECLMNHHRVIMAQEKTPVASGIWAGAGLDLFAAIIDWQMVRHPDNFIFIDTRFRIITNN
jgi:hypothetical protein